MLTDFQNSFVSGLGSDCVISELLNYQTRCYVYLVKP